MSDTQLKDGDLKGHDLNRFLKQQRVKIEKLLSGEINGKAKIVLSGPSNSKLFFLVIKFESCSVRLKVDSVANDLIHFE